LGETVGLLVKLHRKKLIKQAFGADRGRIKQFGEAVRGENTR
jgi:hypothetical protein